MNKRFVPGRSLVRLLLTLTPVLICIQQAQAQFAPVVSADDQSWLANFQEASGGNCNTGTCGGDSILEPLPTGADCGSGCGTGCGCGSGACDGSCGLTFPGGGLMAMACAGKQRTKRIDVFAEYLYLRPRNAEVAYAVPIDGPVAPVNGNGVQVGPTAVVDPDHQGAYRIGLNLVGFGCASIGTQWTRYENSMTDFAVTAPPNIMRSLVTHPLGVNAASDGLQANAQLDIDFDLIDLIVRTPWKRSRQWHMDIGYGIRYGQLNQNFSSVIDVLGPTTVTTQVDFNGLGPQIGLNSIRQLGCGGLHVYGRGDASFMVGTFDASYVQMNPFAGGTQVNSSWESGRVVPQLEMELGFGWATRGGGFHLRTGYLVNAWFNAVRTSEFIDAVQMNDFNSLGSGISFDGLVVRGEFRF